jgi:hypothetical protein
MSVHQWAFVTAAGITTIGLLLLTALLPLRAAWPRWVSEHPWRIGALMGTPPGVMFGLADGAVEGLVIAALSFLGWGWLRPRLDGRKPWLPRLRASRPPR